MTTYSIADLEQISGIKAHTIRIWEQRYNALKPMRSAGNTRYYDSRQLQRLLNVVSLLDTGKKVSELFSMSDKEINALLDEQFSGVTQVSPQFEYFIAQLLQAGLSYNEVAFEKHYSACLIRYGMKSMYLNVLQPLLFRVGLIWSKNAICPSQEHFLSCLIKQKISASIDLLPYPTSNKKSWLLFLPNAEYHEVGLLLANFLIRSAGHKTIYLGSNVPFNSVISALKETKPTDLFFFFIRNRPAEEAQEYITKLHSVAKNTKIHLAGNRKLIEQLKLEKRMDWIQTAEDLDQQVH